MDLILNGPADYVEYFDAYDHAMEGIEQYGFDILIDSAEEAERVTGEFDVAHKVIKAYLETGNAAVQDGSGLPEF